MSGLLQAAGPATIPSTPLTRAFKDQVAPCNYVPPAGFEPAHTAPECVSLHGLYLRKRPPDRVLGRVWGGGNLRAFQCSLPTSGECHLVRVMVTMSRLGMRSKWRMLAVP